MSNSLYQRLGEAEGISRIVDDIVAGHLSNPVVKTRFEHAKDLSHLKKMACEFFCAGSGGPQAYSGKDMRAAHAGMNISEQEYLEVMDDVVAALEKNDVDEASRNEVVAIMFALKGEIIRV